jgi:hypothetical protein
MLGIEGVEEKNLYVQRRLTLNEWSQYVVPMLLDKEM